ncbi:MAG: transposase domain-containing protein [Pseudotabrizicola sp.]|uniref:transposase domain-containing protein n=1 Tax=Pseudotabrizicola sp. TaxID=2939647 RepID=UPI0027240916|nr:transposase domain-containing protein [Pseudotabrizicola sp.]MDO9639655.1 transposase domain-containing protein [Pseudotabrizicola sp.]
MTTRLTPAREWWTAEEIAAAALPDMPATRQGVDAVIKRDFWRGNPGHARRREGRGGGWEYSWRLFPSRAQRKLLSEVAAPVASERPARDEAWAWFDGLPQAVKDKAQARLLIIQKVEALEPAVGKHMAIVNVARLDGIATRTIWNWMGAIDGVRSEDRLAYLAPRHRAAPEGQRRAAVKDCDPDFFDQIKADFLRNEAPPFTDCYRRALRVAKAKGWATLPERTMRRRLDAAVSTAVQVLARQGVDALKRMFPVQVRDKTCLGAMEAVNADFHKFDVFVKWPAPKGEPEQIIRPQMVAFQDIYSGRILSWRLDVTPNSTAVLLCAGDMISEWGIPEHVLLDNGREFAAKSITGGASTRYRFKVREEDIPGLFTALDCKIHWATPYSGQSKPIERAFRDMCSSIAKDPRFAGAYTGNRPDAKPENYGSKAIPLEDFLTVLAEGIEEHNTRQGRRSEVAFGRSFAEVFEESYVARPIRKAAEAQKRWWLLAADRLRTDTNTGAVWFQGNEFWSDWMQKIAGQRVVIRFDPAAFWDGVHIYSEGNAYLGHAPVRQKVGFFDMDEARAHSRARGAWIKAERAALEAQRRMTAAEVGRSLDELAESAELPAPSPEAKVVRPTFGKRGQVRPPEAAQAARRGQPVEDRAEIAAGQAVIVADLSARMLRAQPSEEAPRDRYLRALDLEARMERGQAVTTDQQRWLSVYQHTAEYQAEAQMRRDFGDAYLG